MCECIGVNVLSSLCYKCQCVYICTYTANKVNLNLNLNLNLLGHVKIVNSCYFIATRGKVHAVCLFLGKGRGGTPHMHGHKESYKDLNLKILTSEWDSYPRPHEY